MISNWQGIAFNQDPQSANKIHSDDLAQRFGFDGALVPGVTLSAYLTHPGVEAWGMDFLERANVHVKILSPVYDGEMFSVQITEQSAHSYSAHLLRDRDIVSATADIALTNATSLQTPPQRRGDPIAAEDNAPPTATPQRWQELRNNGCMACRYQWGPNNLMRRYLRAPSLMPALLSGDTPFANMSFILGTSNWAAASNAGMNPWVHLETRSQNFCAIADGASVITEMQLLGTFEKKGHHFFDARFTLFDETSDRCYADIELRAIYRLRQ